MSFEQTCSRHRRKTRRSWPGNSQATGGAAARVPVPASRDRPAYKTHFMRQPLSEQPNWAARQTPERDARQCLQPDRTQTRHHHACKKAKAARSDAESSSRSAKAARFMTAGSPPPDWQRRRGSNLFTTSRRPRKTQRRIHAHREAESAPGDSLAAGHPRFMIWPSSPITAPETTARRGTSHGNEARRRPRRPRPSLGNSWWAGGSALRAAGRGVSPATATPANAILRRLSIEVRYLCLIPGGIAALGKGECTSISTTAEWAFPAR